jgi:hypothetical protein
MLIKQLKMTIELFIILASLLKRRLHSGYSGLCEFSSAPFGEFSWYVNYLLYKAQLNYPTKRINAYICEFSLPPFKGVYLHTSSKYTKQKLAQNNTYTTFTSEFSRRPLSWH